MANTIYMTVGITGVGKSTFVKTNLRKAKVFSGSSDEICKDMRVYLSSHDNATVVYDATNAVRKRRRAFYDQMSRYGKIHILFFFEPLAEIYERNAKKNSDGVVSELSIKNLYKKIQPPRIGVDCDMYSVYSKSGVFNTKYLGQADVNTVDDLIDLSTMPLVPEIRANKTSHDSPFHKESVDEHIALTIKNADSDFTKEVARYHDLGKGVTKTFDDNGRAMYSGHANLGSVYAFVNRHNGEQNVTTNDSLVEVVYQHMNALANGLEKAKRLDKLTSFEIKALSDFAKVDEMSTVRK